jgi:hypothetical protein
LKIKDLKIMANVQNVLCDVIYDANNQLVVIDRYETVACTVENCRAKTAVGPYCVKHTAQMYRIKIQFPSPQDYIQRKHSNVFVLDDRYLGPKCYSQSSHTLLHPVDMTLQSTTFKVRSAVQQYFTDEQLTAWCQPRLANTALPYRRPMYFVDLNPQVVIDNHHIVYFRRHWFGDFLRRTSDVAVANCALGREMLPNAVEPSFKLVSLQTPGNVIEVAVAAGGGGGNAGVNVIPNVHADADLIDPRNNGVGGDPRLRQYDELILYDPNADLLMRQTSFNVSRIRLSEEQLGLRDPVTGQKYGVVGNVAAGGVNPLLAGVVWRAM